MVDIRECQGFAHQVLLAQAQAQGKAPKLFLRWRNRPACSCGLHQDFQGRHAEDKIGEASGDRLIGRGLRAPRTPGYNREMGVRVPLHAPNKPTPMPMFHHCVPLDFIRDVDVLVPSKEVTIKYTDWCHRDGERAQDWEYFDDVGPNLWLQERTGFYPLFVAVGDEGIFQAGYNANWRRVTSIKYDGDKRITTQRRAGQFPNVVLFSFEDVPDPVFVDYQYWFIVLGRSNGKRDVSAYDQKLIFKPKRTRQRWLRTSRSGDVMAVVPSLDLRTACRVWVRNEDSRKLLEPRFRNVQVKRVPVVD